MQTITCGCALMTQTVTSQPMKRVEDWKSRLIDLSRRNNLLYFHKDKRGNLPISQPDPQSIFNALVLKKHRLEFWIPPEETEKQETAEKPQGKIKAKAKTAKDNPKAAVKEQNMPEEPKQRPSANQLVSENLSHADLKETSKACSGAHFSITANAVYAFCMRLLAP